MRPILSAIAATWLVIGAAACSKSHHPNPAAPTGAQPAPTPTGVTVVSQVTVTNGVSLKVGEVVQLRASASFSDGSHTDVTAQATWSTDDTRVFTLQAAGLVKGQNSGQGRIFAAFQGVQGVISAEVLASGDGGDDGDGGGGTGGGGTGGGGHGGDGTGGSGTGGGGGGTGGDGGSDDSSSVVGLDLIGNVTLAGGATSQLSAVATLSDGTKVDVTATASWQSSNALVAKVNAGVVTGVGAGLCNITVTHLGVSASLQVRVEAPVTVVSLRIEGNAQIAGLLVDTQLKAIATMSDGTEVDVTAQASWSCNNSLVALISATGNLRSLGVGTCDVTVVYLGVSAKVKVSITLG